MNKNTLIAIAVVAVLLLGGVFLLQQQQNTTQPAPQTTAPTATAPEEGTAMEGEQPETGTEAVKTIEVEAGSFYFKPDKITVKKGEKVRIQLTAVSLMHNFTVDEFNVQSPTVENGNTGTVEFTPDKAGIFEFYCGIGQHRANGQKGTLTVEE